MNWDWEKAGYMDMDQDGDVDINDAVLWENMMDEADLREDKDDREYALEMTGLDPDDFDDMDEDEIDNRGIGRCRTRSR